MTAAGALVNAAARRLPPSEPTSSRLEAELLLGKVTGWSRTSILTHPEWSVSAAQEVAFQGLVGRREASEPLFYLLGEREFYGRTFKVDPRALIPRPETELLVDLGLAAVARWRATGIEPTVVELGTGSGAVAVSLASVAKIGVIATDISFAALQVAAENAGLARPGRISLVQTDLLAGLRAPLHVILGNLPYIPSGRDLPSDVKDHEPHVAIFGGRRGTEIIERLFREARPLLAPGAELCVELDEEEQAAPMAALASELYAAADVEVRQDAGGYDRVVRVQLPG